MPLFGENIYKKIASLSLLSFDIFTRMEYKLYFYATVWLQGFVSPAQVASGFPHHHSQGQSFAKVRILGSLDLKLYVKKSCVLCYWRVCLQKLFLLKSTS
jgi:putative effector of murein hydrolase